jgi:hypothetical protein
VGNQRLGNRLFRWSEARVGAVDFGEQLCESNDSIGERAVDIDAFRCK